MTLPELTAQVAALIGRIDDTQRPEYILCAANHYDDGKEYAHSPRNILTGFVICGRRHNNCIAIFAQMVGFPYDENGRKLQQTERQGFITSTNRFVDRHEALKIARAAGQLITGDGNENLGLFSEDLY